MTRLLFAVTILTLMTLTACSEPPQRQTPAPSATPQEIGSNTPTDGQATSILFPRHDAPLGTDRGGEYFAGQLVITEGCLRAEAPSYDATNPQSSRLLIWPGTFTLEEEPAPVRIVDGLGRIAAHVGDHVRLSRATVNYQDAMDQGWIDGISEDCEGPFILVGDEVTAFDPRNEASELRLSEPDVLLLRSETVLGFPTLPQALGIGELVLDGQCLRLDGTTTIVWPAGFTPHVDRGEVQVRNGAGKIVAVVGDEIAAGGGYNSLDSGACSGPVFGANQIKVLPNVEVYFPKQDGTVMVDQEIERFEGKLALDGKCLIVNSALRVRDRALMPVDPLIIWPSNFSLGLDDGNVRILDATGRAVAHIGGEVQFSAFELTYEQAMDHGGLEDISPACASPYWALGDEFSDPASQAP